MPSCGDVTERLGLRHVSDCLNVRLVDS